MMVVLSERNGSCRAIWGTADGLVVLHHSSLEGTMQFSIDDSPIMAQFVMGKCVECACSVWGHGFGELGMFLCVKCPTSKIIKKGNRDVGGPLSSLSLPQICVPGIRSGLGDNLHVLVLTLN